VRCTQSVWYRQYYVPAPLFHPFGILHANVDQKLG